MNTPAWSASHPDPVVMIATCLTDHFIKQLYEKQATKGYCGYLGCLNEILDWATEFHDQYYSKLDNWEKFRKSKENIYNAANRDAFLIAWGNRRMELKNKN